ncbi:FAST kinase domain-containing protein 3, mitochondrial-like isoform X2 [Liolophura sinensis]|uniref:FAST kinase domain-containing protein 3, mitochondrial-like isoform X2 n=1 Tax=Liolophura sinensis TaxID=3198878 RepID=UPI00315896C0
MAHSGVNNSVLTLRWLARVAACCRTLPEHRRGVFLTAGCVRSVQNDSTTRVTGEKKLLSLSSLIRQDGLEIQELPIIVKRASQTFSPFSKILSCADSVKSLTEQDENFKLNLQNCVTVKQVFKLLEVPSDQVTGYSAAFALQRISQLRETSVAWDGDDIDNFIRTAVMNELYDTVIRDISCLSDETLIGLVKCYLSSDNFSKQCVLAINTEIENRLAESKFDLDDLCKISNDLLRHRSTEQDLIEKIWAHVGMRTGDLNENNITSIYRSLPLNQKHLIKILDRHLLRCWWKLTGEDVAHIMPCLVRLKSENRSVLTAFGKWVFMNFHMITDAQLTNVLAGFVKFNFYDANLVKALERYIPAKDVKLDTNLLALVMEYSRSQRFLSPCILDTAAAHFQQNYKDYKPLQAYSILRTFGYLSYAPRNYQLFMCIEDYLEQKFNQFSIPHITELLCSFSFIGRHPINFAERVFSASFLSRVHSMNDEVLKCKTEKSLEMLQSAIILETKERVNNLYKVQAPSSHCWMDERHHMLHNQMYEALVSLVGPDVVTRARLSSRSAYFIDFALCCHPDGTLMNNSYISLKNHLYPHKFM